MICRKCGVKNRETSSRCFNCGASLIKKIILNEVVDEKNTSKEENVIPEIIVPIINEKTVTEEYEVINEFESIREIENIDELDSKEKSQHIVSETEPVLYTGEDVEEIEEEAVVPETEDILYIGEVTENDVCEESQYISEENDVLYTGEDTLTDEESPTEENDISYTVDENVHNELLEENDKIKSVEAEEADENVEFIKKFNRKKLLWLLLIIPITLIFVIGYIIFDYLRPLTNSPDNNTIAILKIKEPQILKKTDENGIEYINAVFYGKAGDVLKLKCNDTSYDFLTDKVEINLFLTDIFPSDYVFDSGSVNIDLKAYYFRDKEYLCETPSIDLKIPSIETDLTQDEVKFDFSEKYNLRFWVEKDAKVTLNNEELIANHLEIINQEITPTEETSSFELKITKPYHQVFVKTITFVNEENPINLTVSSKIGKIHSSATITLTYIADKNASIYSNLPVLALTPSAEIPDAFDVTLDISDCSYGIVEATITAKVGENSVRKTFEFNYWPNEDELLATAQTFEKTLLTEPVYDKDYIINSLTFTEANGMYKVKGKVGDVELIFDIKDYIGRIDFDTIYTATAKMVNENGTSVFKLWYASAPEPTIPEGEETV